MFSVFFLIDLSGKICALVMQQCLPYVSRLMLWSCGDKFVGQSLAFKGSDRFNCPGFEIEFRRIVCLMAARKSVVIISYSLEHATEGNR